MLTQKLHGMNIQHLVNLQLDSSRSITVNFRSNCYTFFSRKISTAACTTRSIQPASKADFSDLKTSFTKLSFMYVWR